MNIDTPIEVNTGQREQAWTFMQTEELRIGTKTLKMCLFLSKAENQLGPLGAHLVSCGPPLFALAGCPVPCRDIQIIDTNLLLFFLYYMPLLE